MRNDGLLVVATFHDTWVVLPNDDRPAIDRCPCCNNHIRTEDNARIVADRYYPPLRAP